MTKNTTIVLVVAIIAAMLIAVNYASAPDAPAPEISATSTSIQVRDHKTYTLYPTMVEEYEDWIKYVDIMEGDTLHMIVIEPGQTIPESWPDPGNDFSEKTWECRQVVTCERADWIGIDGNGAADPEDHCEYEFTTEKAEKNPANYPSYGAYCNRVR